MCVYMSIQDLYLFQSTFLFFLDISLLFSSYAGLLHYRVSRALTRQGTAAPSHLLSPSRAKSMTYLHSQTGGSIHTQGEG